MIFVDVSPTLPAIPVAICWLLITEWASRPEHNSRVLLSAALARSGRGIHKSLLKLSLFAISYLSIN